MIPASGDLGRLINPLKKQADVKISVVIEVPGAYDLETFYDSLLPGLSFVTLYRRTSRRAISLGFP